jgi:hypothetical protein
VREHREACPLGSLLDDEHHLGQRSIRRNDESREDNVGPESAKAASTEADAGMGTDLPEDPRAMLRRRAIASPAVHEKERTAGSNQSGRQDLNLRPLDPQRVGVV